MKYNIKIGKERDTIPGDWEYSGGPCHLETVPNTLNNLALAFTSYFHRYYISWVKPSQAYLLLSLSPIFPINPASIKIEIWRKNQTVYK